MNPGDLTTFSEIDISDEEYERGLIEDMLIRDEKNYLPENVYHNPLDTYRHVIAKVYSEITGKTFETIFRLLEVSRTLGDNDISLPVLELEIDGLTAESLVAAWVQKFPAIGLFRRPTYDFLFVRFLINPLYLQDILPEVLKDKNWGHNPTLGLKDPKDPSMGRKKMVVEFSSPNIAKPFYGGNLRSTIIGAFMSNLHEGAGWEVVRLNHLGDWNKQCAVLGVGFKMFGDECELDEAPVQHLNEVYARASNVLEQEQKIIDAPKDTEDGAKHDEIKRLRSEKVRKEGVDADVQLHYREMSAGKEKAIDQWETFRQVAIERYKKIYARLDVKFDFYMGESKVSSKNMDQILSLMDFSGLTDRTYEGNAVVNFSKYVPGKFGESLGIGLVLDRENRALQLMRDVGALLDYDESFEFDEMIYVVPPGRELRVKQMFKTVELIAKPNLRRRIKAFTLGNILSKDDEKPSFLDDMFQEVTETAHYEMQNAGGGQRFTLGLGHGSTADHLGITSLKVQDMGGLMEHNYHYNPKTATSFRGHTGAFLQYSHAYLCSRLKDFDTTSDELEFADFSLFQEAQSIDLLRIIAQFPESIATSMEVKEPSFVLSYLFRFTTVLNGSHNYLPLGGNVELHKARLALYVAARRVMQNGMKLLGITPMSRT